MGVDRGVLNCSVNRTKRPATSNNVTVLDSIISDSGKHVSTSRS